MESRRERLKAYFEKCEPEEHLITLAQHGVDMSVLMADERETIEKVYWNLKARRFTLLFPWFWTHEHVRRFCTTYGKKIKGEDVSWYCVRLQKTLNESHDIHWLERVNLFHVYGLLRLVRDREMMLEVLKDRLAGELTVDQKPINTLSDMSAHNAMAMLQASPVEGMEWFLQKLQSHPRILPFFGRYQVFYYGGAEKVVDVMKNYLSTDKNVVVPQSVAALLSLSRLGNFERINHIHERIQAELLPKLPSSITGRIHKIVLRQREGKA